MVQIEDDIYEKLKKDANDNKQVVNIVRIVALLIAFMLIFFTWGLGVINIDIQKRTYEMQAQQAIEQAKVERQIMDIEKGDLTIDQYLKWVEVRRK